MASQTLDHQLAYCRNVYQQTLDWYKSAETKAQIILTLNGVFIGFLGSNVLLQKRAQGNSIFADLWIVLIGLVLIGIIFSVIFSVLCLKSRLRKRERKFNVADKNDLTKYRSDMLFFFEGVKQLDPGLFAEKLQGLTPKEEIEILSYDIVNLAKNVSRKHRYVNNSFLLFGISLLFFVLSIVMITLNAIQG
ncbi:MAG: Pycsar system effector family protein [Mucilaginibacter sp.]